MTETLSQVRQMILALLIEVPIIGRWCSVLVVVCMKKSTTLSCMLRAPLKVLLSVPCTLTIGPTPILPNEASTVTEPPDRTTCLVTCRCTCATGMCRLVWVLIGVVVVGVVIGVGCVVVVMVLLPAIWLLWLAFGTEDGLSSVLSVMWPVVGDSLLLWFVGVVVGVVVVGVGPVLVGVVGSVLGVGVVVMVLVLTIVTIRRSAIALLVPRRTLPRMLLVGVGILSMIPLALRLMRPLLWCMVLLGPPRYAVTAVLVIDLGRIGIPILTDTGSFVGLAW